MDNPKDIGNIVQNAQDEENQTNIKHNSKS